MSTEHSDGAILRHDETELDYAYVRDTENESLRSIFMRFVRPGTTEPADTLSYGLVDAEIDVDAEGRIIGLTVHGFKSMIREEQRAPVTVAQWLALESEAAEHGRRLEDLEIAIQQAEARQQTPMFVVGLRTAAGIMGVKVPENVTIDLPDILRSGTTDDPLTEEGQ